MVAGSKSVDFLKIMLNRDYMYPSSALWRAIELSLLNELDFPKTSHILDLGCGDGYFSNIFFSSKDLKVDAGMDVSLRYVLKAKRNTKDSHSYKSFQVASATILPYKEQFFDIVFSNCVIEHIPNFQTVFSEIQRVLKKNGKLIFTVPSPQFGQYSYIFQFFEKIGWHNLSTFYKSSLNKRLCHYNIHDLPQWESFLNKSGLKVKSAKYYIRPETARICDLLEFIYTLGIWKIRLNAFLIRGGFFLERIGINFLKKLILNAYYNFLKEYLTKEQTNKNNQGAALLIVASKSEETLK